MAYQVIDINVRVAGRPVDTGKKNANIVIDRLLLRHSTVYTICHMPEVQKYARSYREQLEENPENQDLNMSVAMCYLKLGKREMALQAFEKAIEDNFDNSQAFFYAAICRLNGKKSMHNERAFYYKKNRRRYSGCSDD